MVRGGKIYISKNGFFVLTSLTNVDHLKEVWMFCPLNNSANCKNIPAIFQYNECPIYYLGANCLLNACCFVNNIYFEENEHTL